METTNRIAVRAIEIGRRSDDAIVVEVQVARVATARISRPIVAALADIAETIVAVATTRSRVPEDRGRTKLTGEVHTFVGAVVWIATKGSK